jgi:hypothetical protein
MRYSDTHKTETHAKLVKLAGRMLREKGPDKLAVAELMQGVKKYLLPSRKHDSARANTHCSGSRMSGNSGSTATIMLKGIFEELAQDQNVPKSRLRSCSPG